MRHIRIRVTSVSVSGQAESGAENLKTIQPGSSSLTNIQKKLKKIMVKKRRRTTCEKIKNKKKSGVCLFLVLDLHLASRFAVANT